LRKTEKGMKALLLSEVADLLGGELVGTDDPEITGAAGIEDAGPGDLTFLARRKFGDAVAASRATAVIVGPGQQVDRPAIRVSDPYGAFATFLERWLPDLDRIFPVGIHPTAVIEPGADVTAAASIGPYSVIGPGTVVGEGSRLGAHVILGCDVTVGRDCLLYAGVTVREDCRLGDRVIIHSGVVIGSDGFGYLPAPKMIRKIPQVGVVEIQDDVEIGAGSCVDRATTGRTVVGVGSKIDNLVQIGHNVRLGAMCSLSAQTGIAGSCTLDDGVIAGGQVGIADHLKIGSGVKIGAQSGIAKDVPAGQNVFGSPALDVVETFRMFAALRKLPELLRRVSQLEKGSAGNIETDRE
jgi:UDP-3-O-[3-hydroxymyristoyl] glucosamine N-acyltransferase